MDSLSSARQETDGHIYRVGTLKYTFRGLVLLFAWLLWGDFAFTFFEAIFGRFIPLYLSELKAPNVLIGVLTGSIAGAVNILFLPGISQWSDSYRSAWGRRIPFLAIATPLTVGSLILMGFAPEIGAWVHGAILQDLVPSISLSVVILTMLSGFVVAFHYFNMVLYNAFNWLMHDVVPQEVMARFLAWIKVVTTASTVLFNWYVFPFIISHRREVCLVIGVFYLVAFLAMCWKVKEGDYPLPARNSAKRVGALRSFGLYFRECFSIPLYRNYFIVGMLGSIAGCATPFGLLYLRETLGLSMEDLGKIFAVASGITVVLYVPIGWLCDRFTPVRVAFVGLVGNSLVTFLSYFLLTDRTSFIVLTFISIFFGIAWNLGNATFVMELFPSEKFGQFSSAINIFNCGILIFGNLLIGLLMDFTHSNYRLAYLWSALSGLAVLPLLWVYREWKRHGGPDRYAPPGLPE